MIFACTGTRHGPTPAQLKAVAAHLSDWCTYQLDRDTVTELHHGGCVGVDREVHRLCRDLWGHGIRVVIHPASGMPPELCDWSDADELGPPRPALERNADILAALGSLPLLALPSAPENAPESKRSGTWATVRMARKARKSPLVFMPDGSVQS